MHHSLYRTAIQRLTLCDFTKTLWMGLSRWSTITSAMPPMAGSHRHSMPSLSGLRCVATTPIAAASNLKTLVFVESPTKAVKLQQYLGSDYKVCVMVKFYPNDETPTSLYTHLYHCTQVVPTYGHVRDLPSKVGAVKVNPAANPPVNFKWTRVGQFHRSLKDLHQLFDKAPDGIEWRIVLATDPDREGEAIAWHLAHILKVCGAHTHTHTHTHTHIPIHTHTYTYTYTYTYIEGGIGVNGMVLLVVCGCMWLYLVVWTRGIVYSLHSTSLLVYIYIHHVDPPSCMLESSQHIY